MKKFTLITLVALALASCAKTDDDMAQKMLTRINSLYELSTPSPYFATATLPPLKRARRLLWYGRTHR